MVEQRGTFVPIEGGDPGRQPGETIPLLEAQQRLKVDDIVFAGLLHSLLLGYWTKEDGISRAGVEEFERYGTQWRPELRRQIPFPTVPLGEEGQLPDTMLSVRLAPSAGGLLDSATKDVGWIAQFYVRANPFFWPMPGAYSPTAPLSLRLPEPLVVDGTDLPTTLYPGPDGSLAMVMVIGLPAPAEDAVRRTYSIVTPILDELSVRFDQPLPLVQLVVIGIPSGVATLTCAKPANEVTLRAGDTAFPHYEFQELAVASSLYREAISSNSAFHKFLTLWRARENAAKVSADCRRAVRGAGKIRPAHPEVFPDSPFFGEFRGLEFDRAIARLNGPYRVALAHGNVTGGQPRSGASVDDLAAVLDRVPSVRYMARISIENARAILRAAASLRAGE